MAPLALRLRQHGLLLCSTDSGLHNQACALGDLLCFHSDLFSELSRWRDDDSSDIIGFGALVAAGGFSELWVDLNDALDDRDKKAEGFAGARLCLGDAGYC